MPQMNSADLAAGVADFTGMSTSQQAIAGFAAEKAMDSLKSHRHMFDRWLPSFNYLRTYFAVNHAYVLRKLLLLGFPFKPGRVEVQKDGAHLGLQPVSESGTSDSEGPQIVTIKTDVEEPELYIPLMGFFTYVILISLHMLLMDEFHPEVFDRTVKFSLLLGGLENGVAKVAFLAVNSSITFVDIMAIQGYKYVNLSIVSLLGIFVPKFMWWIVFLYFGAAAVFTQWRFLTHLTPYASEHTRQLNIGQQTGILHKQVIIVISGLQIVSMFFLLPSFSPHNASAASTADHTVWGP